MLADNHNVATTANSSTQRQLKNPESGSPKSSITADMGHKEQSVEALIKCPSDSVASAGRPDTYNCTSAPRR